jgi:hypothetical protein
MLTATSSLELRARKAMNSLINPSNGCISVWGYSPSIVTKWTVVLDRDFAGMAWDQLTDRLVNVFLLSLNCWR